MIHIVLLTLPLLTALTAWATAYLLIYGVLYPLHPIRIAGITIQGFLPAYLKTDAAGIAALLAAEVVAGVQSSNLSVDAAAIRPTIEAHLDAYLRIRLREKMPVIASFIGDSTLTKLKESMIEEIDALLPQVVAMYVSFSVTVPAVQDKILTVITGITPSKMVDIAGPVLAKARKRVPLVFAFAGLCFGLVFTALFYCML